MENSDWWKPRWGAVGNDAPDSGRSEAGMPSAEMWASDDSLVPADAPLLESLEAEFQQIRSKDRVRDLAEVFTHQREVDAMLDMMPDAFEHLDIKFLEPACGSGNFLVEILRRKLALVSKRDTTSQEQYEHRMLRALASIYGVDISPENVEEAHVRMAHVMLEHFQTDANTIDPTIGFLTATNLVIHANILLGDTLTQQHQIEMCDWQPRAGGRFQRVWSNALLAIDDRGLLWGERLEDEEPVHYGDLASKRKALVDQRWL